jgi:hypothetical protein
MLRLAAPLATPRIKAAVAQNLGKLRLVLEGSQPVWEPLPDITGRARQAACPSPNPAR